MAIDIEAIRKKVSQLNGSFKHSRVQFWRPEPGEYTIRILPWSDNDGQPFRERWFYYGIGKNPGLLAPTQYQKADPVQELIDKLHASGKKEDKEIAKKLYPKMRVFAPVLLRGQEELGVQVWSFGKEIYQRMLEFFLDSEIGDITDVNTGYDLKIKISKRAGTVWMDTTVDAARKDSKLAPDQKKIDELLTLVPNLDDYQKLKSYDELKSILDAWSRGDDAVPEATRGAAPTDELEKLTAEINASKSASKSAEVSASKKDTSSKSTKKDSSATLDDVVSTKVADLDSVFDEILDS